MTNPWSMATPEQRQVMIEKSKATRAANREAEYARQRAHEQRIECERREALVYADGLRERIDAMESRIAELERMEAITLECVRLTGKALLLSDEIAAASTPWEPLIGVYFLLNGDRVVYVGQSVNVFARITQHSTAGVIKFDRYALVPCQKDWLDKIESLYIHCLRPAMNGNLRHGDSAKCAPLSLYELIGYQEP